MNRAQIVPGLPGFGASFGQGLSTGLQALAEHKLGQVLERQNLKRDTDLLVQNGIPQPVAQLISSYPQNQRLQALQLFGSMGALQSPSPIQEAQRQALTPAQQQEAGLSDVLSSLNQQGSQSAANRELSRLSQGRNPFESALGRLSDINLPQQRTPSIASPTAPTIPTTKPQPAQPRNLAESLSRQPEPRRSDVAEKEELKLASKARESFIKDYKAARESNMRLDRMEDLLNKGVAGPIKASVARKLGLEGWLDPNSQEFIKLTTDFARDAKNVFGSRLAAREVDLLLKTVPSLFDQDDAGRRAVINLRKLVNDAAKVRYDTMRSIIKANGGNTPANLEEIVEESAAPQLDAISERFKRGLDSAQGSDDGMNDLPDPSSVSPDTQFRDNETGKLWGIVNGQWQEIS
jgi:hypothetical protein